VSDRERILSDLAVKMADEGKLIELGWVSLLLLAVPADAPPVQIREMRNAFMAGAQHLFASITGILDPEDEPTDADLRRMDLIAAELEAFRQEVEAAIANGGRWT
jgi:hypothetical protein